MNPSAGRGRAGRETDALRIAIASCRLAAEVVETGSAASFVEEIRKAKREGCRTMAAMGGDGTARLLVNEIVGWDVTVGLIPAGGGNDFATALQIPKTTQEAVAIIARGNTRNVDLASARFADGTQGIYLGGGGMGLDAEAARYAAERFRTWPGRIRYLASAIAALRRFPGVEIQADFPHGESAQIKKRVLLALVLNTPTLGGGLRLAPEARVDDGKLDLVLVDLLRWWEVLALIPRLLISGGFKTQKLSRARAVTVKLSAIGEPQFQADGELLNQAPVEISVMPAALRVFVP